MNLWFCSFVPRLVDMRFSYFEILIFLLHSSKKMSAQQGGVLADLSVLHPTIQVFHTYPGPLLKFTYDDCNPSIILDVRCGVARLDFDMSRLRILVLSYYSLEGFKRSFCQSFCDRMSHF